MNTSRHVPAPRHKTPASKLFEFTTFLYAVTWAIFYENDS